jgi:hypothetical protein
MSKTYSVELIKRLIKQISGDVKYEDGNLLPEYVIKGKGSIWCFSPNEKAIVKLSRGIAVYLIEGLGDVEGDKCLIYSQLGGLYMIDCEELELVGFD